MRNGGVMVEFSREWWKERLSLISAYAEGDDISFQGFTVRDTCTFNYNPKDYTIKVREYWVNVRGDVVSKPFKTKPLAEDMKAPGFKTIKLVEER